MVTTFLYSRKLHIRSNLYRYISLAVLCLFGLMWILQALQPKCDHELVYFKNGFETQSPSDDLHGRPRIVFWARQHHCVDWELDGLANGDGGCDVSLQRKDIDTADAVVFFMKSCKPYDLPPENSRRKNQVYIWFSHESPWTTFNFYKYDLTKYKNYFNWTMTYRTDSDVVAAMWPTPAMDYLMHKVGRKDDMLDKNLVSKPTLTSTEYSKQVAALLKRKTKSIAWIVSDCGYTDAASKRLDTIATMEKIGMSISKYGGCGGQPLPFNFTAVFDTLAKYKFYLAFENSLHCQDYITEKTLYNSFVSGTVPIIHGPSREDAEKILPKGSYIHVEDFPDMHKLAEYLNYLDRNDTAYVKYFEWWMDRGAQTFPRFGFNFGPSYVPRIESLPQYEKDDVQDDWLEYERFGLYHLCRKLKRGDHLKQSRVVSSLSEWWYYGQSSECRE